MYFSISPNTINGRITTPHNQVPCLLIMNKRINGAKKTRNGKLIIKKITGS
jgi:hypothetical protein